MPTQPNPSTSSFDASFVVFSLITLIALVTCCVMWAQGQEPPATLATLTLSLVGVFVGARLPQSGVQQMAKSVTHLSQALE